MIFLRGFLIAAALTASYLGLTRGWLSVQCREPIDLTEEATLAAAKKSSFWATALGSAAATGPLVLASEGGKSQAAWLPIVAPDDAGTAIAVAITSLDHARKLRSIPRTRIEGMARLPTRAEGKRIRSLCAEAGLVPAPAFRMLEAGGEPPSLMSAAALFLLGAGFLYAALRWRPSAHLEPAAWPAAEAAPLHFAGTSSGAPLPDEVKLELQHMMREVWEAAG